MMNLILNCLQIPAATVYPTKNNLLIESDDKSTVAPILSWSKRHPRTFRKRHRIQCSLHRNPTQDVLTMKKMTQSPGQIPMIQCRIQLSTPNLIFNIVHQRYWTIVNTLYVTQALPVIVVGWLSIILIWIMPHVYVYPWIPFGQKCWLTKCW